MAFQTRQGFGQQQPAFQQHHHHHHQHQQQFVPGQQQFVPHQQHHNAQPSVSFPGMNGPQAPQQQGFPGQQGFPVVGQQQQFQPHHHHQQHHSAMPRQHHHHHHHHHSHHQHQMAAPVHVPPQAPVAPVAPGSAPVANFQGFVGGNGFTQQSFGRGGFGGPAQQQQPAAYEPYTREEVSEDQLFKDHSPGINFDKYESIDVTVTPNEVPPCDVFQAMDFNSLLHDNIRRCNYNKPTPVQKYGIPIVLFGKDLMACAQTGSGKTAAYLLPALHHAMKFNTTPHQGRTAHPSALILAPTRELALQIYDEGRKFTYRTGLRCVVVYGGADSRHQIYELQRGANLIVATPGRLLEMFQRGIVSFSQLKYLVLDEADRMLDMGFEPQIRQLVEGPDSDMPAAGVRQTLMYSATFPREIQQLARSFLSNHVFLQVGRVGSTTDNITQDARWVEEPDKREMLLQILGANVDSLVLVFVEKKREADFLERFLHHNRISATSIHGDRTQREREMALHYFKTGACRILVATDVAARGLDIPNVSLVIQYDLPTNIDDYVHRIGRTGRAGKTGTAIAFFNDKNVNIVDDLVVLLEESKQQVPDYLRPLMKRRPVVQARGRGGRGGYFGRGRGFGGGGRGRGAAPGAGGYGGFNAFSGHPHHHPHHVGQSAHGGNHFAPPARF